MKLLYNTEIVDLEFFYNSKLQLPIFKVNVDNFKIENFGSLFFLEHPRFNYCYTVVYMFEKGGGIRYAFRPSL